MDGLTIKKILESDQYTSKSFIGVYARNKLPQEFNKLPVCFVFNTQADNKKGEHWLACYIDENNSCEFFDSYGNKPNRFRLENYFNKTFAKWSQDNHQIQGFSEYCGYYCILFLLYRARNKLNLFYYEFKQNSFVNDKKLKYLIDKFTK